MSAERRPRCSGSAAVRAPRRAGRRADAPGTRQSSDEARRGLLIRRLSVPGGRRRPRSPTCPGGRRRAPQPPDVIHVHDLLSPASIGLLSATARRVPIVALRRLDRAGSGHRPSLLHEQPRSRRLRCAWSVTSPPSTPSPTKWRRSRFTTVSHANSCAHPERRRTPGGFRPPTADERAPARRGLGIDRRAVVLDLLRRLRCPVKRVRRACSRRSMAHQVTSCWSATDPSRAALRPPEHGRTACSSSVHVLPGPWTTQRTLLRAADLYIRRVERRGSVGLGARGDGRRRSGRRQPRRAASNEIISEATSTLTDVASAAELARAIGLVTTDPPRHAERDDAARATIVAPLLARRPPPICSSRFYRRLAARFAERRAASGVGGPFGRPAPGTVTVLPRPAYWRVDGTVVAERSFVFFLDRVAEHFGDFTVIGGLSGGPPRGDYALAPRIRFVALPEFRRGGPELLGVAPVLPASLARVRRVLRHVDVLWLFGPGRSRPRRRGRPRRRARRSCLNRQHLPAYARSRRRTAASCTSRPTRPGPASGSSPPPPGRRGRPRPRTALDHARSLLPVTVSLLSSSDVVSPRSRRSAATVT